MKYSLLLDSSNSALSVGLGKEDGSLLDGSTYEANQRQSEVMVDEIDRMLKKHSLTREDLFAVISTKGPGSYTGVRISLTIAKTVSFALNIPLYLASSLEMLKDGDHPSICLSNARSKRSYIGVYEKEECILPDQIMDNDKVLSYLESHPDYSLCGDLAYLKKEGKPAQVLENLAKALTKKNLVEEPLGAKPVYLKDSSGSSQMKIIVRPMISADLSQVMEISKESFGDRYSEDDFRYELLENPFGHIFVAVVDAQVVGFLDFMVTFDSSTINLLAVKKDLRKHGIGTRLIGSCVSFLKEQKEPVSFLTLEVRKSNETAQKFYKRHAFEFIVTKPSYYENGEDALYFVRSLIND